MSKEIKKAIVEMLVNQNRTDKMEMVRTLNRESGLSRDITIDELEDALSCIRELVIVYS